jgi:2-hydroxychromene-2-carboxylate isomerase
VVVQQRAHTAETTFYFDVGSPYAYLTAERVHVLLGEQIEWQPILLGGLFRATGRSSWALGDHRRRQEGIAEIERRARAYGLPAVRWPDPWPTNYLAAMLASTFASAAGRGREFARAAFRNAFQRGWDLSVAERVLETGAQVGLDRRALSAAVVDAQVKRDLRSATDAAYERGVVGVPTIAIGEQLFWGDDRLEDVAAHLRGG